MNNTQITKMNKGVLFNWSTQEMVGGGHDLNPETVKNGKGLDINEIVEENEILKQELEFYKSLFKTHNGSCVFNLTIKKKNGTNVWVDHVRDSYSYIESLDKDEEVRGWLEPVKPSR